MSPPVSTWPPAGSFNPRLSYRGSLTDQQWAIEAWSSGTLVCEHATVSAIGQIARSQNPPPRLYPNWGVVV